MKRSYIINENTMCLVMKINQKTNQVYTIVLEHNQTFYVLTSLENIVRSSLKYYEQDLTSYLNVLEDVYGKRKLPIVISYDDHLLFIKSKLASFKDNVILLSPTWIKEVRPLGEKTQIKFKNGKFKTVGQKAEVIVEQQQLAYSVVGVLGYAKRKGV